jgi:predicted CoA-binding protein
MRKFSVSPSEVIGRYRTIAVVGASKNPEKDASSVPAYLVAHGYTVIPVNPTADMILGLKAYPSLAAMSEETAGKVDVVQVFRPSEEFPDVARQVVEMKKRTGRPFVFWGQLGLENEEAKEILLNAKVDYVMDRCMRTEHQILGWSGSGTGGKINEAWHNANKMPDNPTPTQRVRWHFAHAMACGCRSVPDAVADEVRTMIRAANLARSG